MLPLGALIALIVVAQIGLVVYVRKLGLDDSAAAVVDRPADYSNTQELGHLLYTQYLYPFEIAAVILLVAIVAAITLTMRDRPGQKVQDIGKQVAVRAKDRVRIVKMDAEAEAMIPLSHVLLLSGILFSLAVAGIFINRKNVLLLLMCIELMLLSVNFNFIAFSHYLGDLAGQVFVFFILTVAAAESAIGLAILVVLFRERRSINVEDLDAMRG